MEFKDLIDFINARKPEFMASAQGVSAEVIQRREAEEGFKLPKLYVDFLLAMGKSSGDLLPLGGPYAHDFDSLLPMRKAEDPETYGLKGPYFQIGYMDEENAITYIDLYMDLARSDGHDAPLLEAESGTSEFPNDDEVYTGQTLGERLTECIFSAFAMKDHPDNGDVFINATPYDEKRKAEWGPLEKTLRSLKDKAVDVLRGLQFELALPSLPQIACLTRTGMNATVEVSKGVESIVVDLSGDDRALLTRTQQALRAAFPNSFETTPEQHFHGHENSMTSEFRSSHSKEETILAKGIQALILRNMDEFPDTADFAVYYTNPGLDKELYPQLTPDWLRAPLPDAPSRDFDRAKKGMGWDRWSFDLARSLYSVREEELESLPANVKDRFRKTFIPMGDRRVGHAKDLAILLKEGSVDLSKIALKVLARLRTDGTLWDAWKAATLTMSGPEGYLGPLLPGMVPESRTAESFKWHVEKNSERIPQALSEHLQHFCLTPDTAKLGGASRMGCPDDFHVYRVLPGYQPIIGWQYGKEPASLAVFMLTGARG